MRIMRIKVRDYLTVAFKLIEKNSSITNEEVRSKDYTDGCIKNNLSFLCFIPNSTTSEFSTISSELNFSIRAVHMPTSLA